MSSNISGGNSFIYLGKNTKKDRKLDAEQMKGGIKRENIAKNNNLTDAQKARMLQIFDAIDSKKVLNGGIADGILDANEIKDFWELLTTAAGDEKLNGNGEINNVATALGFNQNDNNTKLTQEELFQFLGEIANEMEDIESSTINERGTIIVTHKKAENGSQVTEKFLEDGSKIVETKLSTGTVSSYILDKNEILQYEKEVTIENGVEKVSYIYYDEEGKKPIKKIERVGTEEKIYKYENDKPVLTQISQRLTEDIYKTIDFIYTEDGFKQKITIDGQPTVHEKYTNIQLQNGTSKLLLTGRVTEGEPEKTEHWDYETGIKTEWFTENDTNNETKNEYVMVLNEAGEVEYKQKSQEYLDKNTNTRYRVLYDANGNTPNVIVQRGETLAQIAGKYGCDVNELKEANKHLLNRKGEIDPGTEIVIPGKMDAKKFSDLHATRKSAATILNEIQRDQAREAARRACQQECDNRVLVSDYDLADWVSSGVKFYNKSNPEAYAQYKRSNDSHLKMIARYLYKLEGTEQITTTQYEYRIAQIRRDNPGMFDREGFLIMDDKYLRDNKFKLNLHLDPSYAQRINVERDATADAKSLRSQERATNKAINVADNAWKILNNYVTPDPSSLSGGEKWNRRSIVDALNGKLSTNSIASFLEAYRNHGNGNNNFVSDLVASTNKGARQNVVTFLLNSLKQRCQELGLNNTTAKQLNSLSWNSNPAQLDKVINAVAFDIRKLETVPESKRANMLARMNEALNADDIQVYTGLSDRTRQDVATAEQALKDNPRGIFERLYDATHSDDDRVNAAIRQFKTKYDLVKQAYLNSGGDMAVFDREFQRQFGRSASSLAESLKQFRVLAQQQQSIGIYNNARMLSPGNNQVDTRSKEQIVNDIMEYADKNVLKQMLQLSNVNQVQGKLQEFDKPTLQRLITEYTSWAHELSGGRTSDRGIDAQLENLYRDIMGDDSNILGQTLKYISSRKNFANNCEMGVKALAATLATVSGVGVVAGAFIVGGTSATITAANHSSRNADRGLGYGLTLGQWGDATIEGIVDGGLYYTGYKYGGNLVRGTRSATTFTRVAIGNGALATAGDIIKNEYDVHVMGEDKPIITFQGVAINFFIEGVGAYADVYSPTSNNLRGSEDIIERSLRGSNSSSGLFGTNITIPNWVKTAGNLTGVVPAYKFVRTVTKLDTLQDYTRNFVGEAARGVANGDVELSGTEPEISTPATNSGSGLLSYATIPDFNLDTQNSAMMLPMTPEELAQFRLQYGLQNVGSRPS